MATDNLIVKIVEGVKTAYLRGMKLPRRLKKAIKQVWVEESKAFKKEGKEAFEAVLRTSSVRFGKKALRMIQKGFDQVVQKMKDLAKRGQ